MKDWFTGLNQREQLSLLVLGFALGLYLVYMLVW
ncbi:MAG: type II secretion system protein M, partial [Halioglobus sp.]|nr:type II secretion system protein M [Halioglobus sp.]